MIDFSQYPGPLRRLLEHLLAALYGITKELELTGKTLEQWFEEVKTALARFHIASYMAGKGSPFLTPQDRANIGSYLAPQIDFLENFKVQIASAGEFQRGWYNRAAQYARSIVAPYWKGKVKVLPLPAMPGDLSTPCGQLCACGWDVKPIDPENGDYDAYWILNAQRQIKTEHCQICVERARLWAPLEIREGMLQIPEGMLEKELPEHEYAELVKAVWMEGLKHLAGRHDQLSHGNWAYGPDKGGGGGGYEKPAWLEREYPLTVDPDKPGAPGQGGQSIGGFGRYVGYVDGKSGRHHIVQGELALAKGKFGVVEDNPRTYGLSGPTVAGWDVTPGQAVERIERRAQEWAEAARAREEQNKRLDQFRIHRVGKDPTQAIPSDLMNMLTRGYERASRQNASIFLQQLGMPKKSSDALLRGLSHYFSAGGSKLYNPREILNEYYKWLDSQPAEKALGPRFRLKHLQGQHNQDSHGSWAHGMDKVDRYMARLYNRPEPRFWMRSGELPGPEREAAGMVYRYWIEKPLKTPVPDSMTSPDGRTLHTKEPVPIHKILLNKLHPLGEARGEAALEYYRRRFGGKDGDPMVFTNGKKGAALRGALLHPSTRQLGTVQMTVFDADGFSGDSTYNTWADAAAEAVKMYRYAMSPAKFDAFALQDRFLEGVASTWAMQQQWAREQAEWRKEHKEAVTRADLLRHVEGLIELKHLPGKHPQERHGWRYGSRRGIAGTLRKIHGRKPADYAYPLVRQWDQERGEYKRRIRAQARGDEYARERVIREREREIAGLDYERGYFISQDGRILYSKNGDGNSLSFDRFELQALEEETKKGEIIFIHNHPYINQLRQYPEMDPSTNPGTSGNSFSHNDILYAMMNNLAEVRATTQHGMTYIMRRPGSGWPIAVDAGDPLTKRTKIEHELVGIAHDVYSDFDSGVSAGLMSKYEMSANFWHEVWLRVTQKYPEIEYTWEFDPGRPEPHESARDITY